MPSKSTRSKSTPGPTAAATEESAAAGAGAKGRSTRHSTRLGSTTEEETPQQAGQTGFVMSKNQAAGTATAAPRRSGRQPILPRPNEHATGAEPIEEEEEPVAIISVADNAAVVAAQSLLDSSLMLSMQDTLFTCTDTFFGLLSQDNKDAVSQVKLEAHRMIFNNVRQYFSTPGSHFVDVQMVKNALATSPSDEAMRVPPVVSAANLATLMDSLSKAASADGDLAALLQQIDGQDGAEFPWRIVAPESVKSEQYDAHNTFDRAVDMRIVKWGRACLAESYLSAERAAKIGCELFLEPAAVESATIDTLLSTDAPLKPIFDHDLRTFEDAQEREQVLAKILEFWKSSPTEASFKEGFIPFQNNFIDNLAGWTVKLFQDVKQTVIQFRAHPGIGTGEADEVENQLMEETEASQKATTRKGTARSLFKGKASLQALSSATGSGKRKRGPDKDGDAGDIPSKVPKKRARRSTAGVTAEHVENAPVAPMSAENASIDAAAQALAQQAGVIQAMPHSGDVANGDQPGPAPADGEVGGEFQSAYPDPTAPTAMQDGPPPVPATIPRELEGTPEIERVDKAKVPKKRNFWKQEEANIVMDLVARFGSNWSGMEAYADKHAMFDVKRTQQHIRDKARNIKLDLVRKDQRLPQGFDNVLFSAKEERMLRKHQKNPDRRESDVDDDGNVTNNTVPVEYKFM